MNKPAENKNVVELKKPGLPSTEMVDMYAAEAGAGMEDMSVQDMMIPFLSVLQALSPQLNKQNAKYIKGAEQGMILNTLTNEAYDGEAGISVVPVYYKRQHTEWVPRAKGGGFLGERDEAYLSSSGAAQDPASGKLVLPNGNEIVTSGVWYVLVSTPSGGFQQAVISMTGTQLKKSRNWLSRTAMLKMKRADGTSFTPPLFAGVWKLTTVPESNEKGSWFGWKIDFSSWVHETQDGTEMFQAAKAMHDGVRAGTVKAQAHDPNQQGSAPAVSDDIPF